MKNGRPIHIIADDLTGSADTANYFRTADYRVRVAVHPQRAWNFALGSDIVQVLNTESRALSGRQAAFVLTSASEELYGSRPTALVYKKIDSTMRGNVGIEIGAALRGLRRAIAIVAPTFPAMGRTVRNGVLYIDGIPVDQTAIAHDPVHPVRERNILKIIQSSMSLPAVFHLPLEIVRSGTAAVIDFIVNIKDKSGPLVIVADAETEQDLDVLANVIGTNSHYLPCGSAGLAKALSRLWIQPGHGVQPASLGVLQGKTIRAAPFPLLSMKGLHHQRILVIVGSAHEKTHEQMQILLKSMDVHHVELNPLELLTEETKTQSLQRAAKELVDCHAPVLLLSLSKQRVSTEPSTKIGATLVKELAGAGAIWVRYFQKRQNCQFCVVATGGDTAVALCNELGISSIWPEGELLPGVPWSTVELGDMQFPLVSKAGGFGNETALREIVHRLYSA